ncbi:hypothetical protein [Kutzneria buriramensis]|uniref:Uncharacterized protein n=1 Tax=Kutzneria buriramensis TaxID=1045776 RepID=A0A3E0HCI4_9PSEU|nr:hypothetical protein [Kutzneria buriramensis]REH42568.1 hypothetical protein BCF44_11063 [Kutzneria buriramensis]
MTRFHAAALLVVTLTVAALAASNVDSKARMVSTILFFLLVPGSAAVALARPAWTSVTWSIAIGISVAADVLVAQAMLLLGWHPVWAFGALLTVSAGLLTVHLVRPV